MPHFLNTLALYNKAIIYDIFFKACSQTLNAFASDPRFLGAKLGFIGILHTWGQSLCQHVHIHFIVSGGGISVDGKRSPNHDKYHDNMFCLFPEVTIDFMSKKDIPFIAFKILAGGAILPEDGFKYAFENGADFICVGMFDYQVIDDVNIAIDTLSQLVHRERAWFS